MPYFKGVFFETALHTEQDVLEHNAANPVAAEEPVLVEAAPAPTPEAALEALEVTEPQPEAEPQSEPGLAVPVDRETPIVEMSPAIDAEADPFPSFVPEEEPETQPEAAEAEAAEVMGSVVKTAPDSPDGKKKKSGGRSGR